MQTSTQQSNTLVPARYWHRLEDGRVQCDLCPRYCKLKEGQRGLCFVRQHLEGEMKLTTMNRSSGFAVDPIEKKPLNHFLPGSKVFSFGTAGCNLACKFCQNWDISKSREMDRLTDQATPEQIALTAQRLGCQSVAFTYNDPVIFFEYALATAEACHDLGLKTVAVSAGYICDHPRREFFSHMDAANIDLKGFDDAFYRKLTGGRLQPVLDTLQHIAHETDTWLEITCLLIPGANDDPKQIAAMSRWIHDQLGADVPLHFSAFHPDYRMRDIPPTPLSTLRTARQIARDQGLHHVYTGNVHDREGDTTYCQACGQALIVRDWYRLLQQSLNERGHCPHCGSSCAGVWHT